MKTNCSLSRLFPLANILRRATILAVFAAASSQAITILSGPAFAPAANAPLAGTLTLTTDAASQVSVSVNDGVGTWERDFFDYGKSHSLTVLGFKPHRTNEITVIVRDKYRNVFSNTTPLTFVTGVLPPQMPVLTLITNDPARMEPGYTLFRVQNNSAGGACVTIVNSAGEVVWYGVASSEGGGYGPIPTPTDVVQLTNGNLFFPETSELGFGEVNMLGQTVATWSAPYSVDAHEDLITPHGSILYINYAKQSIPNFPSSATDPNAPTETASATVGWIVEISYTNSSLLNLWSLISMLDPVRINYLCFLDSYYGIDPEHANAVIEDPSDNSLIVSMRNQDAIIKFSRQGQLKWILGPTNNWGAQWQKYLLTPTGTPFTWNYGQHAPIITPQGTLLFYDDGNCRAEPFDTALPDQDNYSRAAEFSIDETNMQVSQVWEFTGTNTDRLYASAVGNASLMPQTGNVLVDYGYVSYENGAPPDPIATNATIVRIKEVTHEADPSVVFDLELSDPTNTNPSFGGYMVYRTHRIPDLYVHPANPVANLTVQIAGADPLLQFTADPALNYTVQVSSDLVNWSQIGSASQDDSSGNFSFLDDGSDALSTRFYRVITD